MIQFKFNIDRPTLVQLGELFEDIMADLPDDRFRPGDSIIDQDTLLAENWHAGLEDAMQQDADSLKKRIFDSPPNRLIRLSDEEAEAILRAAAMARLYVQNKHLSEIPDDDLESGEMNIESLDTEEQSAFGLYLFLGGLQAIILRLFLGEDPAAE